MVLIASPRWLRQAPLPVDHTTAGLTPREWRVLATASLPRRAGSFLIQFYGLSLTTVSHAALMWRTMP
jgi:hypothetical protein